MKIKIYLTTKGSPKKMAEASVFIEDGDFRGLTIRGFQVWKGKQEGELFVTPPNVQYQGKDGQKKFFHHVVEEVTGSFKHVKDAILEAYNAKISGAQSAPSDDDDLPL